MIGIENKSYKGPTLSFNKLSPANRHEGAAGPRNIGIQKEGIVGSTVQRRWHQAGSWVQRKVVVWEMYTKISGKKDAKDWASQENGTYSTGSRKCSKNRAKTRRLPVRLD
jgi:hypothetical protein